MISNEFQINEDFISIQGEGYHAGKSATFIRLAGCNGPERDLDCSSWCDTSHSTVGWTADFLELEDHLEFLPRTSLIVFTGGEPLLQQDLIQKWHLNSRLLKGVQVCVETNGTINRAAHQERGPRIWYTVSPKGPNFELSEGPIAEIKLVITPELLSDSGILDLMDGLRYKKGTLCEYFLQPLNNDLDIAKEIVEKLMPRLENPNWRLSLQIHKLLGVR
jgi:organic radical activating enzyme